MAAEDCDNMLKLLNSSKPQLKQLKEKSPISSSLIAKPFVIIFEVTKIYFT